MHIYICVLLLIFNTYGADVFVQSGATEIKSARGNTAAHSGEEGSDHTPVPDVTPQLAGEVNSQQDSVNFLADVVGSAFMREAMRHNS